MIADTEHDEWKHHRLPNWGRSQWAAPDDSHLIDATQAFYVVGLANSGLKGAMGAVLGVFSEQSAAQKLASMHGGRVLRFAEIDQAVLQQSSASQHAGMHGAGSH